MAANSGEHVRCGMWRQNSSGEPSFSVFLNGNSKSWRQVKGGKISHKSLNGIEEKEGGEEEEEGLLTRNE